MLEWKERRVNNIPSNPRDCYWAIGQVGDSYRLYTIIEQYPCDTDGMTTGNEPELYVLFEEINGRPVGNVFTNEKELEEWKFATEWGGYWFKSRGSFVHAYKSLDDAKARAETQISHIHNIIDTYFSKENDNEYTEST